MAARVRSTSPPNRFGRWMRCAEQQRRISGWVSDIVVAVTPAARSDSESEALFVPGLHAVPELFPGLAWQGTAATGTEPDAEPEVANDRPQRAAWKWVHLISKSYWFAVIRQILGSHWHGVGELQKETRHPKILEDRIKRGLGRQPPYGPRR